MIEPSQNLQSIFEHAVTTARSLEHEYITIEHIVYSIVCDTEAYAMMENFGANASYIKTNLEHYLKNNLNEIVKPGEEKPKKTNSVERVLNRCFTQVLFSGRQRMEVADIIVSVLAEKNSFSFY
jgi:ATP-dependent Clp protease ATP-binding subunit ClpA